ncbi:hypothetical protein DL240_12700 [Lujinxingia litoralis]|uniref:Uncharacterized protein n=1 Tax=Lujinxingia litoralis TaxID=2211119 RepID=A0A328C677_9DELT|nr:hypothetical protein [Lujinxingia litoralis]RAL21707.1 hypothetical protein DL240_12700 [Lujinxingia litoralis]
MSLSDRLNQARASYFAARHRHLRERGAWADALASLVDEASWIANHPAPSSRWVEILMEATEIAAHLEDASEYRAFLNFFADHLLGTGEAREQALLDALGELHDLSQPRALEELGSWLAVARHTWPLGPYLKAHGLEQRPDTNLHLVLEALESAARRAEAGAQPRFARHCRMRQAALRLTCGQERHLAYPVLNRLNWAELDLQEQLWMAHALTFSERWIDRVRAIDMLLDLNRLHARNEAPGITAEMLQESARGLLRRAPLHLHRIEAERLPELLDALVVPDQRAHWQHHLEARQALQSLVDAPLDTATSIEQARAHLDALYAMEPERWGPAARSFGMLFAPPSSEASPALASTNVIARFYLALTDTLHALDAHANPGVALDRLNASCAALGEERTSLRVLALLWPRLFEHLDRPQLVALADPLEHLAAYHSLGPTPSYGWWTLAAHQYARGLDASGFLTAERARQEPVHGVDADIFNYVKSKTLKNAASRRDAALSARWLAISL